MGYGRFDADEYRLRIMLYSDAELIEAGKSASPGANKWVDPVTKMHSESKYELCKQEWRRRHPKTA
jgi:hypothetical protein